MATTGGNDTRVQQFREYVSALNKQFNEWVTRQWVANPTRFWSNGLQDYLRNVAKIRREFADVLSDDDNKAGRGNGLSTPPSAGASTPTSTSSAAAGTTAEPSRSGGNGNGGNTSGSASKPYKYEPQLSLTPYCNTKVIHFIRHGEGFHNVGYSNNLDAQLTERGWDQAHALGRHMYSRHPTSGVQLVVVSPLVRALETAAGIFGVDPLEAATAAAAQCSIDGDGGGSPPPPAAAPPLLMVAQGGERNARTAHAAVAPRPGVRFVAMELCRERLGPSQCDKRRSRSEAAAAFPAVDFSLIDSEDDPRWEAGRVESESLVVVRGFDFLNWVMQRPETNIAVVTHSAFLWFTLTCFGNEFARPVRENLQRWYENCEARTLVLSDGGGAGVPDATWFRGGEAYAEPQKKLLPDVKTKGKGSVLAALRQALGGSGNAGSAGAGAGNGKS